MKLEDIFNKEDISTFFKQNSILHDFTLEKTSFSFVRDIYTRLDYNNYIIIGLTPGRTKHVIIKRNGSDWRSNATHYKWLFSGNSFSSTKGKYRYSLAEYTEFYIIRDQESRHQIRQYRTEAQEMGVDTLLPITQRCLKKIEPSFKQKALRTFKTDMKKFIDSDNYSIVNDMVDFIERKEFMDKPGTHRSRWSRDHDYQIIKRLFDADPCPQDPHSFRLSSFEYIKTYYTEIEEQGMQFVLDALES